ncbi:MAG: QVPTGV class sortase B protein-sorting domain-containing protein [Dehalococcoidia bacterium]|nr:QVPTGV class sortase B protein-sorting domain-containing protein [Dehalococcoidia bacterium]
MEKTWKPTAGGICAILGGVVEVIIGLVTVTFGGIAAPLGFGALFGAIGAPFIILGIIAIVGGIYATKRRTWGLALAGSICALPAGLGILAIIFVIMGKGEFK